MADTPKKLKDSFGPHVVRSLAHDFGRAHADFDAKAFVRLSLKGFDDLELLARGWRIAEAMRSCFPEDFEAASDVLISSLGPELERTEQNGMVPFRYLPHVFFVAKYGLEHFDASMRAQYALTKRFTAEYSIRPFLVRYPEATLAQLMAWTRDDSEHVRRLCSEGARPRLPWAPRLRDFQRDPTPVFAILERLKDDPSLYVRRSVANNLNDIGKDHPNLLVEVCRRWWNKADDNRRWIIRHALRSLIKKGDEHALDVLGFGKAPKVKITDPQFSSKRLRIGSKLVFSFQMVSGAKNTQELLVDYAVDFVKADGRRTPKVFKLDRVTLAPRERVTLQSSVSFREMTTRRHYPGVHVIRVLVNGVSHLLGEVELQPSA